MRNCLIFTLVFNVCVFSLKAQNYTTDKIVDSTNNPDKFLFADYTPGVVFLKNGNRVEAKLNYQMDNQSFYYLDNENKALELDNAKEVDTVFIADMKFISFDSKFYYLITNGQRPLFGSFFGKPMPIGYSYDISGLKMKDASETSGDVSNTYVLMQKNRLSKLKFNVRYWLLEDNKLHKIGSVNQIERYFTKLDKNKAKNYLEENKVNFDKVSTVGKFVQFCELNSK